MKKFTYSLIAFVIFFVGFASGRYWDGRSWNRSQEWEEQRRAVSSFYAEVPGFAENLKTIQPMLDQVQDDAIRSIRRPPTDDATKEAYLTVVALFFASREFKPSEGKEEEVAQRAWDKLNGR